MAKEFDHTVSRDSRQQTVPVSNLRASTHRKTHTDTCTHTDQRTRFPDLAWVAYLRCSSHDLLRPRVSQPLSPVVHAFYAISGELALARSKFRRTQSPPYLIMDLRLPPTVHIPPRRPKPRLPAANPPLCARLQNDSMRDLRISPLRSFKE